VEPTLLSLAVLFLGAPGDSGGPASVDFVRDVRPIFEKHCHGCHGPTRQRSGLRLDVKAEAMKGGDTFGPAIVPGKAAESPLIQLVSGAAEDLRMPPKGEALSADEVATLTDWIDGGASWPDGIDPEGTGDRRDHWSFQPPDRPALPRTVETMWARNAIDRFILARLEAEGLRPAPEVGRAAWLRRVSLDLTGLPPSPERVASFVADPRPDAYERVVDELLASPRYGERWAQHWLDVVRYADTHGFEVNTERPHAWPYRDYVIRALNADTPYDRFLREQIAGEALGQDAATGFLVTASVLLPGQIGADEPSKRLARQDALDEIVTNVGLTFLGLSLGCARCHDHKFDPISQRDYYAMQAFFAGVEYGDRPLRTPEAEARREEVARLRRELDAIDRNLARLTPQAPSGAGRAAVDVAGPGADEIREAAGRLMECKTALAAKLAAADVGHSAFAGTFRAPDVIHRLHRGDPEQPKEEVVPAVPGVLGTVDLPAPAAEDQRRRVLAEWIASPSHPLTARVMVNRIWQGHFGVGLVETPSDFGRNGARPSHPELLDWLASELVRGGWSMKHMHRIITLSATYRQSSRIDPAARALDADARLLWRFPSRRLEAEVIRDAMLAASGRLDSTMGGPGFNLFRQRGGLSGFTPIESFGGDGLRRMIYAHRVRRERDAVFGAFDCPDGGQSAARRGESTTPIQALNLFNSRFTVEESAAFAARVRSEAGDDAEAQVRHAYRLALGRDPDSEEMAEVVPVVREHGLDVLGRALFNSNEFLSLP
jgi:mono/diheme cytochrome c family protein